MLREKDCQVMDCAWPPCSTAMTNGHVDGMDPPVSQLSHLAYLDNAPSAPMMIDLGKTRHRQGGYTSVFAIDFNTGDFCVINQVNVLHCVHDLQQGALYHQIFNNMTQPEEKADVL